MFTEAMFRLVDGEVDRITAFDPHRVNEEYDAVVVPAANWLNPTANFDVLCQKVKQLEIPVITIGIGLQAESADLDCVVVSESARQFIQVLSRKAPFISVRGDFTRDWLHSIGVSNVVTTGCPSLYMKIARDTVAEPLDRIGVQSTRYMINPKFAESDSVNRRLFEIASQIDSEIIFQSEIEEMKYLIFGDFSDDLSDAAQDSLERCYGVTGVDQLKSFLNKRGKVFLDLAQWSDHVRRLKGVIGTRLHGSIIALNSSVPALLLAHDSRTSELVEFARIPTAEKSYVLQALQEHGNSFEFDKEGIHQYAETRAINSHVFVDFLAANGLSVRRDQLLQ